MGTSVSSDWQCYRCTKDTLQQTEPPAKKRKVTTALFAVAGDDYDVSRPKTFRTEIPETPQEKVNIAKRSSEAQSSKSEPSEPKLSRPALYPMQLISMALLEAPGHRMKAGQIFEWIARNVPGYDLRDATWQNGISATLVVNSKHPNLLYEKHIAGPNDRSKGPWWALGKNAYKHPSVALASSTNLPARSVVDKSLRNVEATIPAQNHLTRHEASLESFKNQRMADKDTTSRQPAANPAKIKTDVLGPPSQVDETIDVEMIDLTMDEDQPALASKPPQSMKKENESEKQLKRSSSSVFDEPMWAKTSPPSMDNSFSPTTERLLKQSRGTQKWKEALQAVQNLANSRPTVWGGSQLSADTEPVAQPVTRVFTDSTRQTPLDTATQPSINTIVESQDELRASELQIEPQAVEPHIDAHVIEPRIEPQAIAPQFEPQIVVPQTEPQLDGPQVDEHHADEPQADEPQINEPRVETEANTATEEPKEKSTFEPASIALELTATQDVDMAEVDFVQDHVIEPQRTAVEIDPMVEDTSIPAETSNELRTIQRLESPQQSPAAEAELTTAPLQETKQSLPWAIEDPDSDSDSEMMKNAQAILKQLMWPEPAEPTGGPTYYTQRTDEDESFDEEAKMEEIRRRPKRKHIFNKLGRSRLAGNDATARLGKIKLGAQNIKSPETARRGKAVKNAEPGYYNSLEEMFDMPQQIKPFIHETQLAFRDYTPVRRPSISKSRAQY